MKLLQITPSMSVDSNVNITVNVNDTNLNTSNIFASVRSPGGYMNTSLMTGIGNGRYYYNFTNTSEYGRYNVTILASDLAGNTNDTEKTWFVTTKTSNKSIILKGETANGSWEWKSTNLFVHKENLNVTVFANRSIPIAGLLYKISREIITKDTGAAKTLTIGETWSMGAGYELTINALDAGSNPRQVIFTLKKGAKEYPFILLQEGDSFVPDSSYFGETLYFIIADNIFPGTSSDMVQLRFGRLTSDNVVIIQPGHKYENLTVKRTSLDGLTLDMYPTLTQDLYLTNENAPINLTRDSSLKIMGDLYFKVENTANLSYYPYFKKANNIDVPAHNLSLDLSMNDSISFGIDFTEMASVSPDMNPDLLGFKSMNRFVDINVSNETRAHLEFVKIKFYYTQAELDAKGLKESDLKILWHNETSRKWEQILQQGYDSTDVGTYTGHVWANLSHLSTFALAGKAIDTPCTNCNGGGGGGGASGENFSNIEVRESYEEAIYKDKVTSYRFKNGSNPISFVNITGNISAGLVNTMVEALKNTSTLVKNPAPGIVYKNANIWVGTSGFAVPKNIKGAVIRFRVNNSWITSNNFADSDIKMVRWDGNMWVAIETRVKEKDSTNTYFEATTDTFSPFAITGLKEVLPAITPAVTITPIETTPSVTGVTPEVKPPINWNLIIGVLIVIGIVIIVYLKWKGISKKLE